MITVGIDVGSISAKAALIKDGELVGSGVMLTGYNARNAGEQVFIDLLATLGIGYATQAGHEVENSGVFSILAGPSEILVITQAEPCLVQLALYRPCGG